MPRLGLVRGSGASQSTGPAFEVLMGDSHRDWPSSMLLGFPLQPRFVVDPSERQAARWNTARPTDGPKSSRSNTPGSFRQAVRGQPSFELDQTDEESSRTELEHELGVSFRRGFSISYFGHVSGGRPCVERSIVGYDALKSGVTEDWLPATREDCVRLPRMRIGTDNVPIIGQTCALHEPEAHLPGRCHQIPQGYDPSHPCLG